jgi:sugar phosphate isomerase/epimerase
MTDLALSSYWRRGCWERIGDFFQTGVEMGFSAFEVSGLTDDAFYREIRPGAFNIASLHNPAPGEMRNREMRRADVLLTSLNDERRQQAVAIARRTLEVARKYDARMVVLHLGQTGADPELESQLKGLFAEGRIAGPEADAIRQRLTSERKYPTGKSWVRSCRGIPRNRWVTCTTRDMRRFRRLLASGLMWIGCMPTVSG